MSRPAARASLLGRVVAVIGLSFFAVEVALLTVFTVGLWRWLEAERAAYLRDYCAQVHGHARAALLGQEAERRGQGARPGATAAADAADDARLAAALAAALAATDGAAPGRPPGAHLEPPGAPIDVWVLRPREPPLRLVGGTLHAVRAGPEAGWPPELGPRLLGLAEGSVGAFVEAPLPRGALFPDRLTRAEPMSTRGAGAPDAVLYLEVSLRDVQRQVAAYGLAAFLTGALAILVTATAALAYLRRAVLAPLARLIAADNAARAGDERAAVIDAGDLPDDELGAIMHSRNQLYLEMLRGRRALDARNAELAQQREELRQWGQRLEALVAEKTQALLAARDRLHEAEKLAAVGRLAANVAHEINNPLAAIAGWAEEARERLGAGDAGEAAQALETIEEQAFRCKETLKRMLGLARAEPPALAPVDVGALAREAVDLARRTGARGEVEVRLALPPAGPTALGDAGALTQVVVNLLDNALDAATAELGPGGTDGTGGGRPWVEVAARDDPDGVALVVTDSGRGVPEALRARVFDPFYTTKPVGRGTGLGLALVASLVEHLGGRVEVADAPAGGAAFRVVLPRPGDAARAAAGVPPAAGPATAGSPQRGPAADGPRPGGAADGSALVEAQLRAGRGARGGAASSDPEG